ncbi:hypothetical protein [Croceicoccus bisphenolivorans]|uniref:hypothetical protein n=1 Tax=Croceicoccus bisphenolivorans TaxID=1783232 RepID=UPI001560B93B|nr:hypothetical protein [Croceicoccus bisphenolivorans]
MTLVHPIKTIPLLLAMVLAACGSEASTSDYDEYSEDGYYADGDVEEDESASYDGSYSGGYGSYADDEEEREEFDEDEARRVARDQLASEGYDMSYGCTIDCSGHEAGWQWGAENGYSTYGNSQSFHEGTMAFEDALDARVREMEDDYEDGEEVY